MMFCPKCGSMLRPKIVRDKRVMACSCGFVDSKESGKVKFTERKTEDSKVEVIDNEASAYPIVDAECPKCKHTKAYSWTQQMRAGDEPETHFNKCVKCSHTWREGR
ncbi:TPA: transcription factor S [Candidatus Woesearchaeota archaeon]|nr:transcription factor S [Candidatus Woesearchaeota archaeon]HIH31736.1 transcription factor S [Candidatus Woesearchaeota archaeon]HIH54706.1 transcription factor S [Candidatus Woesearchaeota archaeon]HIJ01425.1 transcription factor S [Candidatus Woesearchaeota archaeon]HIJ13993.1 transcription factor S [Candidatus Woesearchaeota archaeon]